MAQQRWHVTGITGDTYMEAQTAKRAWQLAHRTARQLRRIGCRAASTMTLTYSKDAQQPTRWSYTITA